MSHVHTQVRVATPRIFELDGEDQKSKGDEEEASCQRHRNRGGGGGFVQSWSRDHDRDQDRNQSSMPAYAASALEPRLSIQGTRRLQTCVRQEIDAAPKGAGPRTKLNHIYRSLPREIDAIQSALIHRKALYGNYQVRTAMPEREPPGPRVRGISEYFLLFCRVYTGTEMLD